MIIRVLLIELQKARSQRILILLGGDKASQSRNPTVSLLQGYRKGLFLPFLFFFRRETLKSQVTHGEDVKSFLWIIYYTAYSALRNPRSQSADLSSAMPPRGEVLDSLIPRRATETKWRDYTNPVSLNPGIKIMVIDRRPRISFGIFLPWRETGLYALRIFLSVKIKYILYLLDIHMYRINCHLHI